MIFENELLGKTWLKDPVNNYSCTYAQLFAGAALLATRVKELQIERDKPGLMLIKDSKNCMPALLGCWMAGIVPAVYSPHAAETVYEELINEFSFDFIITDFEREDKTSGPVNIFFQGIETAVATSFTETCELSLEMDKIALLLFSSGTSGKQKCIPLSFNNLLSNINAFANRLGLSNESSFLCGSPLWHAHGLYNSFMTSFFLHASVIYSGAFSLLNINQLFGEIAGKEKLVFHITPSMIPILLMYAKKNTQTALPSFYKVICGTSFLDMGKKQELETVYQVKLLQQYGMSESLFMTINDAYPAEKPLSVGQALEKVQLEICNETGVLENGETGSIRVKSDSCYGSYYGRVSDNDAFKNGYFYTGDIGYFDKDLSLFITGREKDLIKKGGFSISADSVTALIKAIAGVEDAYTIGMNDPLVGEEIYSFYIADMSVDEPAIKAALKKNLAANFIPKRIFRVDSFAKTDSGKIIKAEVETLLKGLLK